MLYNYSSWNTLLHSTLGFLGWIPSLFQSVCIVSCHLLSHFMTFVNLCICQVHHVLVQVVAGLHFTAPCEGLAEKVGTLKANAAHHHITGTKSPLESITPSFSMCWIKPLLRNVLGKSHGIYFTDWDIYLILFPWSQHRYARAWEWLPRLKPLPSWSSWHENQQPSLSSLCACHRRKLLHVVGHEPNVAHGDGVAVVLHLKEILSKPPCSVCRACSACSATIAVTNPCAEPVSASIPATGSQMLHRAASIARTAWRWSGCRACISRPTAWRSSSSQLPSQHCDWTLARAFGQRGEKLAVKQDIKTTGTRWMWSIFSCVPGNPSETFTTWKPRAPCMATTYLLALGQMVPWRRATTMTCAAPCSKAVRLGCWWLTGDCHDTKLHGGK